MIEHPDIALGARRDGRRPRAAKPFLAELCQRGFQQPPARGRRVAFAARGIFPKQCFLKFQSDRLLKNFSSLPSQHELC
jgi:hypothetical protein